MSLDIEAYLLQVAVAVAARSTCRRKVGCVLADVKGKILATGYNGPPSGVKHCSERGCDHDTCDNGHGGPGCKRSVIPYHCDAVHAEANALIQCKDTDAVYYVAITRAPCLDCTKLLLNSGATRVVYSESSSYPRSEQYFIAARYNKNIIAAWHRISND